MFFDELFGLVLSVVLFSGKYSAVIMTIFCRYLYGAFIYISYIDLYIILG